MNTRNSLWFIIALWGLLAACKKENKMSKIPFIKLMTTTDSVRAGNSKDTVRIIFQFEDGDADIKTDGQTVNIFVSNTRDTSHFNYPFPYIDEAYKGNGTGFKGTATIKIPAAFLLLRDPFMSIDSVGFSVLIQDAAGNKSNELHTPLVYLLK